MSGIDENNGQVISVTKRLRDMRFPVQSKLDRYWRDLKGPRLVPSRAQVDPRAIEDCLEYAFILERVAPGLARFRLAGMHLNDLMGMEVRGMPMTCLFPPDARSRVADTLEEVFSGPATARLALRGDSGLGRPPITAELSLLPMTSDFGDISRVLGALTTQGGIGRTPRRFEVTEIEVNPLTGTPIPRGEDLRPVDTGFAEAQTGFDHAPRPQRTERPHLRLIKSDDD